jgi:hypothetical protein
MMKTLSIAGTAAMFMVGGGILVHGTPGAEALIHDLAARLHDVAGIGTVLQALATALLNALAGVIAGGIVVALVTGFKRAIR